MKRRKSEKDQELADRSYLLRAWKRYHREQLEEALAGIHGAVLARLMEQLKNLGEARALVDAVAREDWTAVDAETRGIALFEIDTAITKLREARGLKPFDDALSDQRPTAFQIIRSIIFNGEAHRAVR
jgi:predicted negative regulator of RcsB-dependent stress response